jgi:hypothetical protein
VGEHYLDTVGVRGSIPRVPTIAAAVASELDERERCSAIRRQISLSKGSSGEPYRRDRRRRRGAVRVLENAFSRANHATLHILYAVCAMHRVTRANPTALRRSMSITKLKTVGEWQPPSPRWRDGAPVEVQGSIRGRVITGMLTGGDPISDRLPVTKVQRARRPR